MGAGSKDEGRRKVGPADPATRKRLLAEALAGNTKPIDTEAVKRSLQDEKPAASKTPMRSRPRNTMEAGVEKLVKPKANIERALRDLGE